MKSDETILQNLHTNLGVLKREDVDIWDRTCIPEGCNPDEVNLRKLGEADVVLFIMSPQLLANSVAMNEARIAFQLQREKNLHIIPLLGKECDRDGTVFKAPVFLPRTEKPLAQDADGYIEVSRSLRRFVTSPKSV